MVIWEAELDGKYDCTVTRRSDTLGTLTVTTKDGKNLYTGIVSLMYGAVFGPDVEDMELWEKMCIEVVDNPKDYNATT